MLEDDHIIEDRKGGPPVVRNGLALCKMHHAAYDQKIVGISPDLTVHVNGRPLMVVPTVRKEKPDPDFLAQRFDEFLSAE